MPNWLENATALLQRRVRPAPEPYVVHCRCGSAMEGVRTQSHQVVRCGRCTSRTLVLPRSVYPPVKAPLVARVAGANGAAGTRAVLSGAGAAVAAGGGRAGTAAAGVWRRTQTSIRGWGQSFVRGLARLHPRRWLTPLRLVSFCILLMMVALVQWVRYSQDLARAQAVLPDALRKGREALEQEDFAAAAAQFKIAGDAVRRLGRTDPQARRISQWQRETTAADGLLVKSLTEIVNEAIQAHTIAAGQDWPATFRELYGGRWVLLDVAVTLYPARAQDATEGEGPAAPRYAIDWPLQLQAHRAEFIADLPIFSRLRLEARPVRVIFAAQLQACRPHPQEPNTWQLLLEPDTAFLWAGSDTWRRLSFQTDPATEHTLASQRAELEIEE